MSIIILTLLCLGVIMYTYIRLDKNVKKVSFAYGISVFILLLLSSLNLLGLYKVSNYTYFIIILSTISFLISFSILSKKYIKENESKYDINIFLDKFLKSKIVHAIVIINLILVVFYKIKYNIVIQDLSQPEIRLARFDKLFDNAFETLFFNYIITGIIYLLSNLLAILIVNKRIKNILFFLITANIIIYSLIGYGRMVYFNIAIYVFINILLKNDLKKFLNIKTAIKTLSVFIIIFVIFTGLLFARSESNKLTTTENLQRTLKSQCEQVIEYSVGGFRLLDNFIKNGFDEFTTYTFGRATFAGLEEIVLYPIKATGIEINSFNNIISKYTQKEILIGENNSYFNAYYTCIMNFYLDFGIIGVIVFPIMHSILIIYGLKNYYKHKNIYSLLLLNYVLLNLFFSIIRWNYQSGTSTFILLILIFANILSNIYEKRKNENIMDSK